MAEIHWRPPSRKTDKWKVEEIKYINIYASEFPNIIYKYINKFTYYYSSRALVYVCMCAYRIYLCYIYFYLLLNPYCLLVGPYAVHLEVLRVAKYLTMQNWRLTNKCIIVKQLLLIWVAFFTVLLLLFILRGLPWYSRML